MTLIVEQGRWLLGAPPAPRPVPRPAADPGFDLDRLRVIVLATLLATLFVMSL